MEHFALNVSDPVAMAAWYEKNLGLRIVRKIDGAHHTHFLGDYSGSILLEIYNNPADQVPPYETMNPLLLHLAFVSKDPLADAEFLKNAGASFVEEVHLPDGSHLVMLRDPWGLAIQFCKRGKSMLATRS
ncbi:MAG TPA: VOC family protein [Saprospiraceae bacterium]|nr:VOC family protein [Saprospiraceae bacterium]